MSSRTAAAIGHEERLALASACTSPDKAISSWRRLMADMRFDQISPGTQRLAAAIFHNLRNVADLPERDRLKGAFKYSWTRNNQILRDACPVLADLNGAAIEYRAVSGAAIQIAMSAVGVRAVAGVDLVVRSTAVRRAAEILEAHEFRTDAIRRCGHGGGSGVEPPELGALTFRRGDTLLTLHLSDRGRRSSLLTRMLEEPPASMSLFDVDVPIPPASLLLLESAVRAARSTQIPELLQALCDVSILSTSVGGDDLLAAARATGTIRALADVSGVLDASAATTPDIRVSRTERIAAAVRDRTGGWDRAVSGSASALERLGRRRGSAAARRSVRSTFVGRRYAYWLWIASGQFATAERAWITTLGGFLPVPDRRWEPGSVATPFTTPTQANACSSNVTGAVLDWRFRTIFASPAGPVRLTLASPSLDSVSLVLFRNGSPVSAVKAGDPNSRRIEMGPLPPTNEFSLRPLGRQCAICLEGLDELSVRFDYDIPQDPR